MSEPAGRARALIRRAAEHKLLAPLGARLATARLVREPLTFALRDLLRPSEPHDYRLRDSGLVVPLRHAALDSATLAEVFYRHDYDPPAVIAGSLVAPESILDLGANTGMFGLFAAARWPGARISAYEPDPDNAAVHERAIEKNGLQQRWRLTVAAAGTRVGTAEFAGGLAMESFVTAPGSDPGVPTITVPVVDVMGELCGSDLVKIDIEGGEWEILEDDRFRADPPRITVLEYHPHLCRAPNPREHAEHLVRAAGLAVEPIWHRDDGYGMFWAWRA